MFKVSPSALPLIVGHGSVVIEVIAEEAFTYSLHCYRHPWDRYSVRCGVRVMQVECWMEGCGGAVQHCLTCMLHTYASSSSLCPPSSSSSPSRPPPPPSALPSPLFVLPPPPPSACPPPPPALPPLPPLFALPPPSTLPPLSPLPVLPLPSLSALPPYSSSLFSFSSFLQQVFEVQGFQVKGRIIMPRKVTVNRAFSDHTMLFRSLPVQTSGVQAHAWPTV